VKQSRIISVLILFSASNSLFASASGNKTNYAFPIIAGAILGIGLALWLKRKK
jgi:LPXTG-motif cell wall-anchored protein